VTLPWEGYGGNWHNPSFIETFKLYADVEYNFIIKTGSYSQIIHANEFNATGGKITCTEFVDANGNIYNNWITCNKTILAPTQHFIFYFMHIPVFKP